VAPVSYGIDEHGIGEPLQMYHRIELDTESEIFQKDIVFHVEGVAHTMVTQSSGQFLIMMLDSFGYSSSHPRRQAFYKAYMDRVRRLEDRNMRNNNRTENKNIRAAGRMIGGTSEGLKF